MTPISLIIVLVVAIGLRLAFLAIHLSDPGVLWSDYERKGWRYRAAQAIDAVTLGACARQSSCKHRSPMSNRGV